MITGNEPAFLEGVNGTSDDYKIYSGLTIRQQFASMAMQGLCASGLYGNPMAQKQLEEVGATIEQGLALASVKISDALIRALNK